MTGPRQAKFGEPWSHHGAYAFDRKDVMTLDAPDEVVDGKEEGVVRARGTGAGRTFERQEEIMARVVALVNAAAGLTTEQAIARLALPEPAQADGWVRVEEGLPEHGATVLTINALDLYPVAAFCFDPGTEETIWLRETEGPEDVAIDGRHEPLYRHPTHWRPLPAPPVVEGGK